MAGTDSSTATIQYAGGLPGTRGSVASKPTVEKQNIVAKGTSNRIFAISADASSSATNEAMPSRIEVSNDGSCPINILTGYETYSDETTGAGATRYLHTMLLPGESFSPPVRSLISTEAASTQFDGTISNSGVYTVPATTTNFSYLDAGNYLALTIEGNGTNSDYSVNALVRYHLR